MGAFKSRGEKFVATFVAAKVCKLLLPSLPQRAFDVKIIFCKC